MALQIVSVRHGNKYGPEYHRLMHAMLPGIVVLGDDRPLRSNLTGWWAKLEVFAPWNADLRPCLCIDLDTYVLGEISPLLALSDFLWLINDFNHPQRPESGLFVAPTDCESIWAGAQAAMQDRSIYGDGKYLGSFPHRRINTVVDGIKSYKVDQLYDDPKGARIVCFHGKPKPHETAGWARDFWNTETSLTKN